MIKQVVKIADRAQRPPSTDPPADIARPGWITIEQCAALIGFNKFTLYHWCTEGRLNEATGLRKMGKRRYRIDWPAFKAAVERGELG